MTKDQRTQARRIAHELRGELETIADLVATLQRRDISPPELGRIRTHVDQGLNQLENLEELCHLAP